MKRITPLGVRDYLPDDVIERNKRLQIVRSLFEKAGYQQVITPALEYWDTFSTVFGKRFSEKCVTFLNPNGDVLVLRPDHTVPIARLAATRLQDNKTPIQFYYLDSVFRKDPVHGETELFQLGVECIGTDSRQNDADIIALCIESLTALGIDDIGIDIGYNGFLEALSEQEKNAIVTRDYVSLGRLPKRGGLDLAQNHKELSELHAILSEKGLADYVQFNEGLVPDTDYYSGIFFECHSKKIGKRLGVGGRYNQLLQHFDSDAPAIGFALNFHHIEEALK